MAKLREQLLRFQMRNYKRKLETIQQTLTQTKELTRYANEYQSYVENYQSISNPVELYKQILVSDVVYHGDYHTLQQSQKSVLRIFREIYSKRKLIVCLEMFYAEDQAVLDLFLEDKLPIDTFFKKIDYHKKWGFNWSHFGPLVEFCKHHHIPVLGINSNQSGKPSPIKKRDIFSAKIIAKALLQHPASLVYVVDGDYHVCPSHLPKEVLKLLSLFDYSVKQTIVYQNVEALYWKLAKENKEEEDVIRVSDDSFCVMNVIPTNKLQSYLNWLEYSEDAYLPPNFKWDEPPKECYRNSIPDIVYTICKLIKMPYPEKKLHQLSIYYADNLDFMGELSEISELKYIFRLVKEKIKNNEGFLIEYRQQQIDKYLIYLANSSLAMAAEEAAHFVHAVCRGMLLRRMATFDRFYRNVVIECIGFCLSKFIVPKRQCNNVVALKNFVASHKKAKPNSKLGKQVAIARFILQHYHLEKQSKERNRFEEKFALLYEDKKGFFTVVSTQLGYLLGYKLYQAINEESVSLEEVRDLMEKQLDLPGVAFHVYLNLSSMFSDVAVRKNLGYIRSYIR